MHGYQQALANRPALRTGRLLLRRPTERDLPAIVAIAGDRAVASQLARVPHPYAEADGRFFLDAVVPAELVWAVEERASGRVVGMVGFAAGEREPGAIELGYYVARERWGHGIATEAGSIAVAYGAGLFGAERLRARFFADNAASGRVLAKLGFIVIGTTERPCLAAGCAKPSVEVAFAGQPAAGCLTA